MSKHHLIIGGQRSGKSRHAENLAHAWLRQAPQHEVTVVPTALADSDEMRARIERHQRERPAAFQTVEAPLNLASTLQQLAAPHRLILVDCLTLYLSNWLLPAGGVDDPAPWHFERETLLATLPDLVSPVVFVSNEVGWGVIPPAPEVREYVDELGWLNHAVARHSAHLSLMVAGQAWTRPVTPPEPV